MWTNGSKFEFLLELGSRHSKSKLLKSDSVVISVNIGIFREQLKEPSGIDVEV